jgi:SOS-response transcriptional repressor LexA
LKENEVELMVPVLRNWMPKDGNFYAIKIDDDSMSPLLEKAFIVIVDVSKRDPKNLLGKMVVARDDEGVKIRWLSRDLGMYLLTPQNSRRHGLTELNTQKGHCVVGEVVRYMGEPIKK